MTFHVIPAKAGIQSTLNVNDVCFPKRLDSRFRGNDELELAKSPYISKCQQSVVCRQGLSVFLMSLRAQRGNLVAVAMIVPRHVLNLNEIATSLRSSQ